MVLQNYPDSFHGDYLMNFCDTLQHYVVEPRLLAPHIVPKFMKSNAIECCNSKVKYYMNHKPRSVPESVLRLKEMVADVKETMIQALYGEGDWMLSPDSNITMISKKAWETKGKEAQDKIFMRLMCGVDTDLKGRTKIQPPIKQDLSEIQDPKEKRLINKQHKITLAK